MIELDGVSKDYRVRWRSRVSALREVSLTIDAGEMVAVTGPPGSGTSTLLNILGCLELPSTGRYRLDGTDVRWLSARRRARLRGRAIGFVFQSFELIPDTTVLGNVELPLLYTRRRARRVKARRALVAVGLRGHGDDLPAELSEGQRQKALIARALINDPPVLLDDEPGGELDAESAGEIMELLTKLNAGGRTIVFATHRAETAAWARRIVRLEDGRVVEDRGRVTPSHS